MSKTISTTTSVSAGITLTSADTPLSITSTGTVLASTPSALYGPSGTTNSWAIVNSGLISSTGTGAAGIQLGSYNPASKPVGDGAVTNQGTIAGGAFGVSIAGPGIVSNQSGGYISAVNAAGSFDAAVYIVGDPSRNIGDQPGVQIVNEGTLTGPTGAFAFLGGSITNSDSGLISGTSSVGIWLDSAGTVVNAGKVSGRYLGVDLFGGGSITNAASGYITAGSQGVYFGSNGGTFTNAGTVIGSKYAVNFAAYTNGAAYKLIAEPGAVFNGAIAGGAGVLELASGSSAGTLYGFGDTITNFSTLQFDQGAHWRISGNTAGLGAISTITGFAGGDTIDLTDFAATGATFAGNVLTMTGTSGPSVTLNLAGNFTSNDFQIASDNASGTDVTLLPRTFTWTSSSGDWNDPAAWDLGSVPSSIDDALIAPAGTNTITVSDSESIANLTLNGPDDALAVGVLGRPGGFLQAQSIAINAGTLTDIGGFAASAVTDDGVLDVVTNATVDLDFTPLSLGGTLLVSEAFGAPGTLVLGAGEVVTQGGASAVIAGSDNVANAVMNLGSIDAGFVGGLMTIDPAQFINQGTVSVSNGETLDVGSTVASDGGTGTIGVGGSATAEFATSVDAGQTLVFTDATGTLRLQDPTGFAASIQDFMAGDALDLAGITADSATWSTSQLTISNAGTTIATLSLPGDYSSAQFAVTDDGAGGSVITTTATCYAAGTRILTPHGEVPIERLHEGDLVLTISGKTQPIRWIGHRRANFRRHPNRQRVLPVRIAAHAFGEDRPKRQLLLSPDHAVYIEGVLIPIRHLINGSTIVQIERRAITYYHIELPQHDVLLAEGLPAESYLEAGARRAFSNDDVVIQLHPEFAPRQDHYAMLWEQHGYAPLVVAGEALDRVRASLAAGSQCAA